MFANTPVSQPASSNDSARRKTNEVRPKQYFGGLKLKLTAAALIFGVIALVAAACGESEDEANQVAPSTTQEVTSTTQVAPSTTQPEARQAETEQDAARPQVAATIDIWASVVEDMTCGQVDVTTIIPSGSDPHHYEPVPQDIIALQNADLVVVNGFNLEETLLDNPNIPDDALMISDLAEEDEHDDEADRYGYTILGSLIPSTSTLAEADIRNTIELEEAIQEVGVKAIFVDVSGDNSDVQNFAERAGVQAVSLYTETLSESGGEADSYLKLMRVNSQRIADALA